MEILLMEEIMGSNQKLAESNRKYFEDHKILAVNIMASPGAGKTSLIMNLINTMSEKVNFGVIEGDVYSSIDAEKIEKLGVPVIQINTGGGCHLDANMIKEAVDKMKLQDNSILFIENVGNLICPSEFDLGENIRLVISSAAEGDDKPYKYVSMFQNADVIILNKTDLKPYISFNSDFFYKGIKATNENTDVFEISCNTGAGIYEFSEWLFNLFFALK